MKTFKQIILSVIVSLPISFIGTFLLTRVFFKLEEITGWELAGHSGPAEWVFVLDFILVSLIIFLILKKFDK